MCVKYAFKPWCPFFVTFFGQPKKVSELKERARPIILNSPCLNEFVVPTTPFWRK
jgi:hypothetical protein